jgi:alanyl aminopeptidase
MREKLVDMAKTYIGYKTDGELHEDLVNTNILTTTLRIEVEDLDQDFTNYLVAILDKPTDGTNRSRLHSAISSTKKEKFIKELRGWILSDRLRSNEIFTILFAQVGEKDKQEGMWMWVKDNFEAFKLRIPTWVQGRLPIVGSGFCSEEKKNELKAFFDPIVEDLSGGPRTLAQVTESIDLCIVKRAHDKVMLKEYLTTLK